MNNYTVFCIISVHMMTTVRFLDYIVIIINYSGVFILLYRNKYIIVQLKEHLVEFIFFTANHFNLVNLICVNGQNKCVE